MSYPLELGPVQVNTFNWLASERKVSVATQHVGLGASVFVYSSVLQKLQWEIGETIRAKRPAHVPGVMTYAEAMSVITHLPTSYDLLAARIYGVGLYAFRQAVRLCGLSKAVSWHNCRHRFANELLWRGCDIRTVQTLLGHADVRTPQIATHVLGQGFAGVQSPLG